MKRRGMTSSNKPSVRQPVDCSNRVEVLQRLQPLDILFAVLWAGVVGWGLQTGTVRQLGMLVGVYAAALAAGTLYRSGGAALAMAFGRENLAQLEFAAYLGLFVIVFGVIGVIIW